MDKMSTETRETIQALKDEVKLDITHIKEQIHEIKNNHLKHIGEDIGELSAYCTKINNELGDMKLQMKEYATNQKWILAIGGVLILQGLGTLTAILLK